ncbi:MAG: fused MFS/spermidine synthase [Planctomycetota bacterium]
MTRRYCFLLFCSGMSVLILEVAWFRRMAQLVGGTATALAGVLAAVIGGMAIGAFLFGPRADRSPNPARLYAKLEIAVTILALLSPLWLRLAAGGGFLTSVLVPLPAAILMGGTLPALAAANRGRDLGWLYAWNTLGGVTGTLLAGFVLLPAFGLSTTMLLAAIGTTVAAAGSWTVPATGPLDAAEAGSIPRRSIYLFAISGFLGMASEVSFARQLVLVFGSSTYSFTTVLAVFLAGIGIGSALGTRLARRVDPERALPWVVLTTALLFAAGSYAIVFLPRAYLASYLAWGDAFGTGTLVKFMLASLVLLPGSIGSGLAFPLAAAQATGRATGRLYGWNTLLSITGSTMAVFLFIPVLGPHGTVAGVALVVAMLAARRPLQIAFVALVALSLLPQPARAWERLHVGVFYAPQRYVRDGKIDEEAWQDGVDLPFTRHGREATVSLFRWYGPQSLLVDGKAVATEQSVGDVQHLELLGYLPLAMKPEGDVAIVGLGLGTTYRAVRSVTTDAPEVFEIEGAVADAVASLELRPERLVVADARQGLRGPYAAITSDPIHPWVRGGGDLYSREYFELCRDALVPGGVACQWLPLYQMGFEEVRAVARTFSEVFQTEAYFAGTDLVLVGVAQGSVPVPARTATIFGEDLTFLRVAGHEAIRKATAGATILTDDTLRLEFETPRHLASPELPQILRWVVQLWRAAPPAPYDSILRAQIASAEGDGESMGDALEQSLRDAPNHQFARRFAGETYLAAAAQYNSEGFLKRARQLLAGDPRLLGVEADIRAAQGQAEEAARLYRELLKSQPDNEYLKRRLARVAPPG